MTGRDPIDTFMERLRSLVYHEVRLEMAPAELKAYRESAAKEARGNFDDALRAILPKRGSGESTTRMQAVSIPAEPATSATMELDSSHTVDPRRER